MILAAGCRRFTLVRVDAFNQK